MSNFKVDWSQQPSKECRWAEDIDTSMYTDPWYTGWCMKGADGGWLMYDCPNGEGWCHGAEENGYLLIHHPPEDKGKSASNNKNKQRGITKMKSYFAGSLAVLLIGLKLTDYIDWSWWLVTFPLWAYSAFIVITGIWMLVKLVLGSAK
tara:strand:+ start:270 stop:713 length:444 start_codon:yes stop_codon:yes gene_type:complete